MTRPSPAKLAQQATQRAYHLKQMTALALRRVPQKEIARQLGVSTAKVCKWLQAWRAECLQNAEENNAELVALEIARYEEIYCEAMEAWKRSQQDKEVKTIEKGVGESKNKLTVRREGQVGDPTLLAKAMDALKAIRELKGLDAPKQTQIMGDIGILSVFEQVITHRDEAEAEDPDPSDPGAIPGQPSHVARLCGGARDGQELRGGLRPDEAGQAGPDVHDCSPDLPDASRRQPQDVSGTGPKTEVS